MGEPRCELCGNLTTTKQLARYARLEVCDMCREGSLDGAMAHVGQASEYDKVVKEHTTRGGSYYDITFSLKLASAQPYVGRLGLENTNLWHIARRAIGFGDPEVGDPLFDDMILIDAPEEGPLMTLLRSSQGAQDACMELLALCKRLRFEPEALCAERRADSKFAFEEHAVQLALLALLTHAARHERDQVASFE